MTIIDHTHLSPLALNLLVAFDALLTERHVTRAAARLGLSQSAMSHNLARLRDLFVDELFVRTTDGMKPTPRAQALSAQVRSALRVCFADPAGTEAHATVGGYFPNACPRTRLRRRTDCGVISTSSSSPIHSMPDAFFSTRYSVDSVGPLPSIEPDDTM